jgi:hypothetical protein
VAFAWRCWSWQRFQSVMRVECANGQTARRSGLGSPAIKALCVARGRQLLSRDPAFSKYLCVLSVACCALGVVRWFNILVQIILAVFLEYNICLLNTNICYCFICEFTLAWQQCVGLLIVLWHEMWHVIISSDKRNSRKGYINMDMRPLSCRGAPWVQLALIVSVAVLVCSDTRELMMMMTIIIIISIKYMMKNY